MGALMCGKARGERREAEATDLARDFACPYYVFPLSPLASRLSCF